MNPSNSDCNSSISNKNENRLIIQNPDGTYSHLYLQGEKDSIFIKIDNNEDELKKNHENLENLSLSDEELQYIIDHADRFDYHTLINEILDLFRTYRWVFLFCLVIEMILSCIVTFKTFSNKEDIISSLFLYESIDTVEASMFFNCFLVLSLVFNTIFYPLGFFSIVNKNVRFIKLFSKFSIFSAFAMIGFSYVNIYFSFVFILRVLLFAFSKFLVNLLVSILKLPSRINNNQRYGSVEA